MSEWSDQSPDAAPAVPARRRPLALLVAAVLLALEAITLWGVVVWQVVELLTATPTSFTSAIALLVIALIAAVWVSAIALNVLRHRSWVRAAAVTWQLLQIAVGIGLFQGVDANPGLGLAIIVPSVVVIGLMFVPSVMAATGVERDSRP
ncbi:hypothetical protein [Glaciibacter sp. 2TAF33]|uniref:hypothetical protein n=1 Tax=Glaciibacter sp. 2TAF33 TaxID=3233015 RepID=UPI003F8DAFD9